eukprot:UN27212
MKQKKQYSKDRKKQKRKIADVEMSSNPPRKRRWLAHTGATQFCALGSFEHCGENYQLNAGFHIDREQLLDKRKASLIIRTVITLNKTPVSVKVL